ncbi:MAG: class I SAM-dependent methyltransferase [Candidatus Pacebacteria bacterium]|nr:class I SAM-dependent methyltransferase [Candidatus Paceibacterota bacterium]MCF7856956.1 class I SAM-dependent methyltransferase [Candidatus Paceibacterota bacterium]
MSNTTNETFSYTGGAALENMNEAVRYNQALLNLIYRTDITKTSRILDFGAGMGTFSKLLREEGYKVDCLEVDPTESAYLRGAGFTVFENLLEVPDGVYDSIYSLNVLEHIEDHAGALSELQKKLKVGGRLFLYVPAFQSLYSEFDAMLGHFRRYKLSDLQTLLEASHFSILDIRYYDTLGFLAAYMFKLLRSKPEQVTRRKIWIFDRLIFPCNRIFDPLFRRWFGKNIFALCIKK